MRTLPSTLPSAYVLNPGATPTADVDIGGYDVMIGGHGFRLATDTQFSYARTSEPTTVHRYDSSLEPGEQSLSPLPWLKSQSSFHAGAGQLNLEQGFTAFEYQQEKVEHIRFDNSLGVDVWTPGQVTRLPDCHLYSQTNAVVAVTATIGGVDYMMIGGPGGLRQAVWASGPDAAPTITTIDMTGSTFVNAANCTVTSIATDGFNYYAVVRLTTQGFQIDTLTYIVSGQISSTNTPTAIYKCSNFVAAPSRHNLCVNPSFETNATSWGTFDATCVRSTVRKHNVASDFAPFNTPSTASGLVTSTATGQFSAAVFFATVVGGIYTGSMWVFVPSGNPNVTMIGGDSGGFAAVTGTSTSTKDAWVRLSVTFTATTTTSQVYITGIATAVGNTFNIDDCLIEQSAVLGTYFDGVRFEDTVIVPGTLSWDGTTNNSTSTYVYQPTAQPLGAVVGWQKARLVAGVGASFYELNASAAPQTALPTPKYTAPIPAWNWTTISESPTGVLAAGAGGNKSSILEFTLDSSGATPNLSGGATLAQLPVGEQVLAMESVLGSWLSIGTTRGVRIGTFDTYTGRLKLGPLSVNTTQPVYDVATRDRFVYGGYSNQQADGKTGLVSIDLTMQVDVAGRLAYAPSLRPPTSAPTGLGAVTTIDTLPSSGRLVFLTPEGIHVEGSGPGSDGDAWIRTSRIRYDTAELKLFKLGRLHGSLDVANIQVTGIAPFGQSSNLGTFGFVTTGDPGEFRLPPGLNEWIQLQFDLQGSAAVLNSYQTKAYPAPAKQHVLLLTVNCFRNETDRFGLDVTDPETPRERWQNLVDLESAGNEVRYVEFTNEGSVAQLVLIDQLEFKSFSRPNVEDDFGGYITLKLRTTEN